MKEKVTRCDVQGRNKNHFLQLIQKNGKKEEIKNMEKYDNYYNRKSSTGLERGCLNCQIFR